MHLQKTIGIALSGGGYRAAAFHIGTLKKLNELGIIDKIDRLSTISGGSITGAKYCLHTGNFESFEEEMKRIITTKSVIKFVFFSWQVILLIAISLLIIAFSFYMLFHNPWISIVTLIVFFTLLIRFQFKLFPVSKIIEKAYDKFLYDGATLSDLCETPEIAIGSTNLQSLRHFTFSKRKMEDSKYAYMSNPILFNGEKFPIARAVIASSSVPFAFTPVSISKEFFINQDDFARVDPKLVDGGVYDNQGIHKLTQKNSSYQCDIVIISDAGNKLPFEGSYNNTLTLLLRTVEIFMVRIKHFQMIHNYYSSNTSREIAYQSLGWDLDNCIPGFYENLVNGNILQSVIEAHRFEDPWLKNPKEYKQEILERLYLNCDYERIKKLGLNEKNLEEIRNVGTNLTKIKSELVDNLILHAEVLTELQIRLYCPTLLRTN